MKTSKKVVIKAAGKKTMKFKKGALHAQLDVPAGEKIPAAKKAAALAGKDGKLAKKRADFAFRGALAAGRDTVKKNAEDKPKPKPKSTDNADKRKKFAAMQKAKKELAY